MALFVNAFPATLPKLWLAIKVVAPGNNPLHSLTLRVLNNEDELQKIIVEDDQLASASDLVSNLTEKELNSRAQVTQFMLVFSPMQFDGPGTLKVRSFAKCPCGSFAGAIGLTHRALRDGIYAYVQTQK